MNKTIKKTDKKISSLGIIHNLNTDIKTPDELEPLNLIERNEESQVIINPQLVDKTGAESIDYNKIQESNLATLIPQNLSISEQINALLLELEKSKKEEMSQAIPSFKKSSNTDNFKDRYKSMTVPVRDEIKRALDLLDKNSSLNKYEIFELIIYNGLKNTDFE